LFRDHQPSLTDQAASDAWRNSSEVAIWKALVDAKPPEPARVGRYLGDLSCVADDLFQAIIRAHGGLTDDIGDGSYDGGFERGVLPPGVKEEDLNQSDDLGYADIGSFIGRPYFTQAPEMAIAFYDRIREPDCGAAKLVSPHIVNELRNQVEDAKKN